MDYRQMVVRGGRAKVLRVSSCVASPVQKVYGDYKERGFEILAFPCNQFGKQEPGSAEDIRCGKFCAPPTLPS